MSSGAEIEARAPADPGRVPAASRCAVIRKDGRPCRATPQKNRQVCVFHDADRADQGAKARRLGGQHRRRVRTAAQEFAFAGLGDAEAIRRLLEIAAVDALNLDASIGRIRLLIATAVAAMKHLEITDLASRLATLEVAYHAAARSTDPTPAEIDWTEPHQPELD